MKDSFFARPSRRFRRFGMLLLCLFAVGGGLFVAIRFYHLPYMIECAFGRCEAVAPAKGKLDGPTDGPDLNHLSFKIYAQPIAGIDKNLSGLAYMPETNQLITVLNRPATLLVLDTDGQLLRRHPLSGVSDTEGVAYLGHNKVAVLQEKKRSIAVLDLPQHDGEEINAQQAIKHLLPMVKQRNNGPEGLGYDAVTDTLYVVKEKDQRGLYAITGVATGGVIEHTDLSHLLANVDFATDLSSVEFDPVGRHLLLLSDEAQMIFTLSLQGELLQSRSLNPDEFALPMPQPEGVAIGAQGHIYVVSEPNLFSVLVPSQP